MAADVLVMQVTRTSAAMVLTMQNKLGLLLKKEVYQLPAHPSVEERQEM